ncbi:MAG: CapA family protein [Muribaculaceae bacterium]|nr:CapA family protein [Muribaculaceae bacterium]
MLRKLLFIVAGISLIAACTKPTIDNTQEQDLIEAENRYQADSITLLFVGDAMQHEAQLNAAKRNRNDSLTYNYENCYSLIAPAVKNADYAIVNLELALGGGTNFSGYPCFSAPDSYASALKNAGFDLFLTANNHCLDRLDKGLRRTLDVLDTLHVDHIGTYHDAAERTRLVPFIKDINGFNVGFLNYTYGTNGIKATGGAEVAYIDRERIAKEIKATRDAGAEIIVVAIHWGIEYKLNENQEQRALADFLVNQGVDIVMGGHPHVVQPMKMVNNENTGRRALVVYSLGNFISNMRRKDTLGGALVNVVIERDSTGLAVVKSADYDLFITEEPSKHFPNFRVVPSWSIDSLDHAQRDGWNTFEATVDKLYGNYNVGVPRSTRHYRPTP